jgi:hypothetical protein
MLERWPNWFRWLLFLPASVAAAFLAYPIILILNELTIPDYTKGFLTEVFLKILAMAWSTAAFIWVGTTIVPHHKLIVSVILAVIYAFLLGAAFVAKLMLGESSSTSWLDVCISIIVGSIVTILVVYYFYEEDKKSLDVSYQDY